MVVHHHSSHLTLISPILGCFTTVREVFDGYESGSGSKDIQNRRLGGGSPRGGGCNANGYGRRVAEKSAIHDMCLSGGHGYADMEYIGIWSGQMNT